MKLKIRERKKENKEKEEEIEFWLDYGHRGDLVLRCDNPANSCATWIVLTITKEGTLRRHVSCRREGLSLDDDSRIKLSE